MSFIESINRFRHLGDSSVPIVQVSWFLYFKSFHLSYYMFLLIGPLCFCINMRCKIVIKSDKFSPFESQRLKLPSIRLSIKLLEFYLYLVVIYHLRLHKTTLSVSNQPSDSSEPIADTSTITQLPPSTLLILVTIVLPLFSVYRPAEPLELSRHTIA